MSLKVKLTMSGRIRERKHEASDTDSAKSIILVGFTSSSRRNNLATIQKSRQAIGATDPLPQHSPARSSYASEEVSSALFGSGGTTVRSPTAWRRHPGLRRISTDKKRSIMILLEAQYGWTLYVMGRGRIQR